MSGDQKGLQRRMRHVSPLALYINCRSHRLALCLKHLSETYPFLDEVDKTLLALWKLFEFSPRKLKVLELVQESYGQRPLTLIRASMTRRLSHLHACNRVIIRYESILDCLDTLYDDGNEPEVYGVRHNFTRYSFVAMSLLLCDALKPVNFLTLYLQEDVVNFTHLDSRVKETVNDLHLLIEKYQQNDFQELNFSKCQSLFDVIADRTALAVRLRGNNRAADPVEFLRSTGIPFIYSLVGEIEDAFPQFQS